MNHVILLISFPLSLYNTFLIFLTDNDFKFLLCFTLDDILLVSVTCTIPF